MEYADEKARYTQEKLMAKLVTKRGALQQSLYGIKMRIKKGIYCFI